MTTSSPHKPPIWDHRQRTSDMSQRELLSKEQARSETLRPMKITLPKTPWEDDA